MKEINSILSDIKNVNNNITKIENDYKRKEKSKIKTDNNNINININTNNSNFTNNTNNNNNQNSKLTSKRNYSQGVRNLNRCWISKILKASLVL